MYGSVRRLFHPAAPPLPEWNHFSTRDEALAYCATAWPLRDRERMHDEFRGHYFTIPVRLPPEDPKHTAGSERVFAHVLSLCPLDCRGQVVQVGKRKTREYDYPPVVMGAAADAALAACQLYVATVTGILLDERTEKWKPFSLGYGCLGYYNVQAITYEPPTELDGRKTLNA